MLRTMPKPRRPGAATVRTTLDLPVALWQRAKLQALREQRDLRDLLTAALQAYLDQQEDQHGNA
jgi:hypothetical protein